MKYIDIHTHSFYKQPDIISITNLRSGIPVPEDFFSAPLSIGIHPWNADNSEKLNLYNQIIVANNLYAIGECGLDKKKNISFELQKKVLIKQIEISENINKPLIIHCVGFYNEIISLKKECNPKQKWIIHGFSGHFQLARQLYKEGFILSFGESIFKQGSKSEESLRIAPPGMFFFETDESEKSIKEIYARAAIIRNEEEEYLIELIYNQFKTLFKFEDGVE